ncbi:MAG TPA: allantoate amidohydrolase [Xanthobacteraceae bacterium]|nr:allantoate amidohydrolase [Xanthobacteraceae bacterium]
MAASELTFGPRILELADRLAVHSELPGALACTYLTPAHRATAQELAQWMRGAGMAVEIDGVANVVGRYAGSAPSPKTLLVGSHYDTVVDAGKYDGRLGILTGLVVIEQLNRAGRRLPFAIELIAFSEEEGLRYSASYIGSTAVAGSFDGALLTRRDEGGVSLAEAIAKSGFDPRAIPSLARRREDLAGYLEVHIEQGPVLFEEGLPLGVVTAIAGGCRFVVTVTGQAGHAGTVPMGLRHDAAAAAAELVLAVERRCSGVPTLVGTVGKLQVPGGATNVIPGRSELSLDIRAADDATRDAAVADVRAEIAAIAQRRGVTIDVRETQSTRAVACSPRMQALFAHAIGRLGIKPRFLPSGAGHDAVNFGPITETGMLFVRCGNGGVSHSPRETITAEDADLGARVLLDVLIAYQE